MAEDLGEVRVSIEEEGAEDAADTIGDAMSEGQSDGGGVSGGSDESLNLLGNIGRKLTLILGALGALLQLDSILELIDGVLRVLELALLPFVALVNTFLRPVLQKLLNVVGNLDLSTTLDEFITRLRTLLQSLFNDLVSGLENNIPGLGNKGADKVARTGLSIGKDFSLIGGGFSGVSAGRELADLVNANKRSTGQKAINISLDWLNEQSNTSLRENVAGTNAEVTQNEGVGSE